MFALPIFPGSRPPSIVGVYVLNFCVRDGNRWTHITINTNYSIILKAIASNNLYSLPYPRSKPAKRLRAEATNDDTGEETRLRVFERCIIDEELVTRTGFEPMLTA